MLKAHSWWSLMFWQWFIYKMWQIPAFGASPKGAIRGKPDKAFTGVEMLSKQILHKVVSDKPPFPQFP